MIGLAVNLICMSSKCMRKDEKGEQLTILKIEIYLNFISHRRHRERVKKSKTMLLHIRRSNIENVYIIRILCKSIGMAFGVFERECRQMEKHEGISNYSRCTMIQIYYSSRLSQNIFKSFSRTHIHIVDVTTYSLR